MTGEANQKGDPTSVAGKLPSSLGGGGGGGGAFHAKVISDPVDGVSYDASTQGTTQVNETFTLPQSSYNDAKTVIVYAYVVGSGNGDEIDIYAYPDGSPSDTVGIGYDNVSTFSGQPAFASVPGPSSSSEGPPGLSSPGGPPIWNVEIDVVTATTGTGTVHGFGIFTSTEEIADLGFTSEPPGTTFVFPTTS